VRALLLPDREEGKNVREEKKKKKKYIYFIYH